MLITTTLALFLGFWSLLFLVDYYCRLYKLQSYVEFSKRTGFVVSLFQLKLCTVRVDSFLGESTVFRRPTIRHFLDLWFFVGVGAAILSSGFMLLFLSDSLLSQLWSLATTSSKMGQENSQAATDVVMSAAVSGDGAGQRSPLSSSMVPIIPGINVPWTQLPLLFMVLMIAGLFHELGHALAAINENVNINGFGVFVVAVYPGAFTELENMALEEVSSFRKLKIFCAGVWHNLFLALLALISMQLIPAVSSLCYLVNKGVMVTDVQPESGLSSDGGLAVGNIVYAINNCKVYNEESWLRCLVNTGRVSYGYCLPKSVVVRGQAGRHSAVLSSLSSSSEIQCCESNTSRTHLCFFYRYYSESAKHVAVEYTCLSASYVTGRYICSHTHNCNSKTVCVHPALFNDTRLIRFYVANASTPVLFVGSVKMVAVHVTISNYVPKNTIAPVHLPAYFELLFRYVFTLSFAFAMLNAIPCYSLDGQFIARVLVDAVFGETTSSSYFGQWRSFVYKFVMFYGSFLLVSALVLSFVCYAFSLLYL
ncbi:unnamed protein product [Soboliphyme baturini]|uniref:Membrane-bound transcription factor site-2 protease n=1 Tax=Soboliphyme baturini TaxID=241478 RepID=A0A183J4N7_9BILA|nr:unnamed protein product [Soboliphyme baturini]